MFQAFRQGILEGKVVRNRLGISQQFSRSYSKLLSREASPAIRASCNNIQIDQEKKVHTSQKSD